MSKLTTRERKKRNELAREYRYKGYKVSIEPSFDDLPEFLQGFQPDLIASSDVENVVIEVKSSETIGNSSYLSNLADALEPYKDWRLEFVMTNPRESTKDEIYEELLSKGEINERIDAANDLESRGLQEASLLMLWSALESLMRKVSIKEDISIVSVDSRALVKRLYSSGIINNELRTILDDAAQYRNSIIHGYRSKPPPQNLYRKLVNIAFDFLKQSN